jgi:uncharacterized protein
MCLSHSSDRVSSWYPGGSFGLDNALPWAAGQASAVDNADRSMDAGLPRGQMRMPASTTSPFGTPTSPSRAPPFPSTASGYRERLRYDGASPHWAPLNFSSLLSETDLPVLLIGGWYDFHRRYMWQDYQRLRSRSRSDTPRPPAGSGDSRTSVRLYVTPGRGWAELPDWPPASATATTFYLRPR